MATAKQQELLHAQRPTIGQTPAARLETCASATKEPRWFPKQT
jgi:hypothetical protein